MRSFLSRLSPRSNLELDFIALAEILELEFGRDSRTVEEYVVFVGIPLRADRDLPANDSRGEIGLGRHAARDRLGFFPVTIRADVHCILCAFALALPA